MMRNRFAPIVVGSTVFLLGLPIVEEREHFHIEQRQYQEPSKLTYEPTVSTATVVMGTVGLLDGDWNSR